MEPEIAATTAPSTDDPASRPCISLLPASHKRLEAGHPWVYSNELRMDETARAIAPGTLVTLRRADGSAFGVAMYNPHSLIAARLLDRDPHRVIDRRFFMRHIDRALRLREQLFGEPFYRLVHAEADALPGLVVDRFDDVLVVQSNAAGMALAEPLVLQSLAALLKPRAIVLRNDSPVRAQEGLPPEIRLAAGALTCRLLLRENGAVFPFDPLAGQKTGWFFDQRQNRAFVAKLARDDARILDLYCYTGGFAVQTARAGAARVLGIDRSEPALTLAREAAVLNGVDDRCVFRRGEVFAEAERLATEKERFDIVIADPPAFAKSRKEVPAALRGYRKLVRLAAGLTARGGFLFLASCSYNIGGAEYAEAVRQGLADAGRGARVLRKAGAGPDHPVHPALPATAYLKSITLSLD